MSGHSKWATIKRKKEATDAKRSNMYAKLLRAVEVAAREGGGSVEGTMTLASAVEKAKAFSVPNDNIERAIKRGTGELGDGAKYEEIVYEGYAPHGVAVLVETATDNPARTVSNLRTHFNKGGGNLASTGSVAFNFKHMGVFRLAPDGLDPDELELELIDHGLEEMGESTGEKGEPQIVIRCAFPDFGQLQKALEDRGIKPLSAEPEYVATSPVQLEERDANAVLALVDRLEQDDDVQKVFHNLA
jgi:YebC/PmpR family DNA-binding regulatory protein